MIFVLPRYLSLYDYGTWQLFLFYFSYVGFLHFGWEDGIYLRYAGFNYMIFINKSNIRKNLAWDFWIFNNSGRVEQCLCKLVERKT